MLVSQAYIEGIKEGRAYLKAFPDQTPEDIKHHLSNIRKTMRYASPTVKEILKGERDFWTNQLKKKQ